MVDFNLIPPPYTVAERFAFHIRREYFPVDILGEREVKCWGQLTDELRSYLYTAARILRVLISYEEHPDYYIVRLGKRND